MLERKLKRIYPKIILKQRVQQLKPISLESNSNINVVMFCGKREFYEGIASLYSFYKLSSKKYSLFWFDDGTLTEVKVNALKCIFPNSTIIRSSKADKEVTDWLSSNNLSALLQLRRELIFGRRLTDIFYYLNGKSVLLLDSDVLFLRRPDFLLYNLEKFESNAICNWLYNLDIRQSYCTSVSNINKLITGHIVKKFNTGLFFFEAKISDLFYLEKVNKSGLMIEDLYYWEQTLFAILATKHKAKPLPENYDVHFRHSGKDKSPNNVICRHYCSDSRSYFYRDFNGYLFEKVK